MPYTPLPHRAVLMIDGADARSFLNGLVTVNTLALTPLSPRYGLLLSAQGKWLHDFFLYDGNAGRILLETEAARVDDLAKRLTIYKLRADVTMMRRDDLAVYAAWGAKLPDAGAPADGYAFPDPRDARLGWRIYGRPEVVEAWLGCIGPRASDAQDYELHRLGLAIPDGERDFTKERTLPMEWRLDALHAIDFDKGCYVGQEVTARSKFRANLRKQPYTLVAEQTLPTGRVPVLADGREIGELTSGIGSVGLALLNSEQAAQAGAGSIALSVGGIKVVASVPDWVQQAQEAPENEGETSAGKNA